MRPLLNLIRKRGMKFVFLMIDDLWLYQYHKKKYDGIVRAVFKTISFIEEKQWEVVGLAETIDNTEDKITIIRKYNAFSNENYLFESRNNNFLLDSVLDFFMFYIPLSILLIFLWNRLFFLLFRFEISKFLRPYSFWLIIFDILIQNNIEFFTFLSFRAIETMFSFDFFTKFINCFTMIFFFIVVVCVTLSYLLYHYKYGKLARYFLSNMYRFPSSYILMIFIFGVRPFLKGVVHALLF